MYIISNTIYYWLINYSLNNNLPEYSSVRLIAKFGPLSAWTLYTFSKEGPQNYLFSISVSISSRCSKSGQSRLSTSCLLGNGSTSISIPT